MTITEKYEKLMTAIRDGWTVQFSTCGRAWRITDKIAKKFENAGMPVLKISGNSLFMANGRHYDCVDFCAIRVYKYQLTGV